MSVKWYSLDKIHKIPDVQYYMIFGERSNGKSYAVNKNSVDNFFTRGEEFIICKRFDEDMKAKVCSTVFKPLEDYILEKYEHKVKFYQSAWWAYHKDSDGKLAECKPMGYALSVNTSDRIKMSQYPNVTTISFEEFMSQSALYLPDEVNLFINIVSTVVRNRTNVKIYLLGNAICKHNPYSDALEIKLHRMHKGEIITREYKDNKGRRTKFAIERTENVDVFDTKENTKGIVYNMFGKSGVGNMITTGDFETHNYNKHICGVTFSENIKDVPKGKYRIVSNKDRINILIKYEDYYYSIYRVVNNNEVVYAFREIDKLTINPMRFNYIINNKQYFKGIINIINLNTYSDKIIDWLLDEILHALKQDKFIFLNNDNGEDVNNAFRIVTNR
jgi:hypothetical protein